MFYSLLRPALFALDAERAHALALIVHSTVRFQARSQFSESDESTCEFDSFF